MGGIRKIMVLWQAVFLAASPLVTAPPSNLTRLYYNGSAAKSHLTTTQYCQLHRLKLIQNFNEILFPPLNYTCINLILNTIITAVFPKTFLAKIKHRKSEQMKEKGKNGARKVKEVRTNVFWVKCVNES